MSSPKQSKSYDSIYVRQLPLRRGCGIHSDWVIGNANRNRTFLQKSYPVIKKHNPYVPVLIREAFGVPARVFARYGNVICLALFDRKNSEWNIKSMWTD